MNIDKLVNSIKTFENVDHLDYYIKEVNNQLDYGKFVTEILEKIENKEIGSNKEDVLNYLNKIDRTLFYKTDDRILDKLIITLSIKVDKPVVRMFKSLFKQAEEGKFK